MKQLFLKKIVSVIILISLIVGLSSCIRIPYIFMHNDTEIVSIEIVECDYNNEDDNYLIPSSKVLVSINDINLFMRDFYKVAYRLPIINGSPERFDFCEIAIKINYINGDYQLVGNTAKGTRYTVDDDVHNIYCVVGFFNEKQYDALMTKYLSLCEKPKYNLLNDKEMIDSIEIVDISVDSDPNNEIGYVCSSGIYVKDIDVFVQKIESLSYKYTLQEDPFDARVNKENRERVIKITYKNGDYELIDDNWRNVFVEVTDEYIYNAYIGEFDKCEFDALLIEEMAQASND